MAINCINCEEFRSINMKRNLFWTIWGITALICIMLAGFKSFALDIEREKASKTSQTHQDKPRYFGPESSR
jgi:hypothetical protein